MVLVEITKKKPNPFITKTNCYQLFKTMVYIFFVYFTLHCIYFLYTWCAINNCFYTVYSVIYLHFSADVPCWGWLKKFSVRTDKLCLEKFVHVICFLVDGFCYYIPCLPYLKKLRFHLDLGRTIGIWKKYKDWPWNLIFKSTVDQDFSLMYISFMPISSEGVLMSV